MLKNLAKTGFNAITRKYSAFSSHSLYNQLIAIQTKINSKVSLVIVIN